MTNKQINIEQIANSSRTFEDMQGFVNAISRTTKVMTWGACAWTNMNDKILRFQTHAHRHEGFVFVAVNGADLFDIYLTDKNGLLKKSFKDIYLEDFINVIDEEIELIPEYNY